MMSSGDGDRNSDGSGLRAPPALQSDSPRLPRSEGGGARAPQDQVALASAPDPQTFLTAGRSALPDDDSTEPQSRTSAPAIPGPAGPPPAVHAAAMRQDQQRPQHLPPISETTSSVTGAAGGPRATASPQPMLPKPAPSPFQQPLPGHIPGIEEQQQQQQQQQQRHITLQVPATPVGGRGGQAVAPSPMMARRAPSRAVSTGGRAAPKLTPRELKQGLRLTVHHASGEHKLAGEGVPELRAGSPVFEHHGHGPSSSSRNGSGIRALPAVLAKGTVVYAPAEPEDHLVASTELLIKGQLGPRTFGRLYVLWPSSVAKVPRWLRHNFHELDPITTRVMVDWQAPLTMRMLLAVLGKYDDYKAQVFLVYEANSVLAPGATFATNGAGTIGEPSDQPYLLAIKLASSEKALASPASPAMEALHEVDSHEERASASEAPGEGGGAPEGGQARGMLLCPEVLADIHHAQEAANRAGGANVSSQSSEALVRLGKLLNVNPENSMGLATTLSAPLYGDDGKLNFDDLPRIALQQRNMDNVKLLIMLNVLSPSLKESRLFRQFERLAIMHRDAELLLILLFKTKHEMSWRALTFLLHYMWSTARRLPPTGLFVDQGKLGSKEPSALLDASVSLSANGGPGATAVYNGVSLADEIQSFLLHYLFSRRQPLSATSAVLRACKHEIDENSESKHYMSAVFNRFQSLNAALLKQVGRLLGHTHSVSVLHGVLDPEVLHPDNPTVNDTSPMQVALDSDDTEFMVHPLVAVFTLYTWHGSAFLAQTSCSDPRSTSLLSPYMGWRLVKAAGFAGGASDFMIRPAMRLWHLYVFTSTSFFNSPRGRWAMHILCEVFFLIIFQLVVFYPRTQFTKPLFLVFGLQVAGNLVEIAQHVHCKHGSMYRINRYVDDPWNALNFLTNVVLAGVLFMLVLRAFRVPDTAFEDGYAVGDWVGIVVCFMAAPVWIRTLSVLVPLFPRLGPLLITVSRMANDLIAFLVPLIVVMAGFTTMLVGAFSSSITEYSNFIQGLLTLFQSMLGGYDFSVFQEDDDGNKFPLQLYLFGSIMLATYIILTTILLLNLLVAILSNRYRPDDLEADTQMRISRVVDYYDVQVEHGLVCSPFCLVQVSLFWIPGPKRTKNRASIARWWGLVPLDGPAAPGDVTKHLRSGKLEVPYFFYLLTLYPIMAIVANVVFYCYAPFAVLRFSIKTFKKLLRRRKSAKVAPDDLFTTGPSVHPARAVGESVVSLHQPDLANAAYAGPTGSHPRPDDDPDCEDSEDGRRVMRQIHAACVGRASFAAKQPSTHEDDSGRWAIPSSRGSATSLGSDSFTAQLSTKGAPPQHSVSAMRAAPQPGPVAESSASEDARSQPLLQDGARRDSTSEHAPLRAGGGAPWSAPVGDTAAALLDTNRKLYKTVSTAMQAARAALPQSQSGRLERLEEKLLKSSGRQGQVLLSDLGSQVLYWLSMGVLVAIGMVVYLLLLGLLLMTAWTTLYIWAGKVAFSFWNIFVTPWVILAREFVASAAPPASTRGGSVIQAAESASPEKRAAIRGKWQAALAKVKQAKAVAQPDSVLGPRDIAGAVSLSKFARLLPKWGCAHMLAGTEYAGAEVAESLEAFEEVGGDDDDDEEDPYQPILDMLGELKSSHQALMAELANIRRILPAGGGGGGGAAGPGAPPGAGAVNAQAVMASFDGAQRLGA